LFFPIDYKPGAGPNGEDLAFQTPGLDKTPDKPIDWEIIEVKWI